MSEPENLLELARQSVPPISSSAARERGIAGSRAAARKWSPEEIALVDEAIRSCAYFLPEFTADDVYTRLPKAFPVTKGLAARLHAATNAGLISPTDRTRITTRGGDHDHGQRLLIWRSCPR